jgi:hypothetical protein
LATLLNYGEDWQNRVQETIASYPHLHARITANNSPFTELVAFVPTPTAPATLSAPTELPVSPSPEQAVVEETAVILTPTPQPTFIPTETPIPDPTAEVSRPILSSQGQLAFIQDQVLHIESEAGLNNFQELPFYISQALWSPDGENLLFLAHSTPCDDFDCFITGTLHLWENGSGLFTSLTGTIEGIPQELNSFPSWSANNRRIFFINGLEGRTSYIDLEEKIYKEFLHLNIIIGFWELPNESVLVQEHLGTMSASLASYDLSGEAIWYYPNTPSGAFAGANSAANYSEEHQLLVISGPTDDESEYEKTTIYTFNTDTYELNSIWAQDTLILDSMFSSDGRFIGLSLPRDGDIYSEFKDFLIIDRDGRSHGTRENSQLLDWRPGGGPVVVQAMDDGQNQLVYWPLDGVAAARIFVLPRDFRFESGKWSADGRYFIYNALDDSIGASYLYLWQPESGVPQLIHSTASTSPFDNFAWMPDGSRVYFNLGNEALWSYEIETADLSLIATTREANPP